MSQQAICGTLFATATIKITHILESLHFFLESNYKLVPLVLWQNAANYDVVDMIIWLKKIKKQCHGALLFKGRSDFKKLVFWCNNSKQ